MVAFALPVQFNRNFSWIIRFYDMNSAIVRKRRTVPGQNIANVLSGVRSHLGTERVDSYKALRRAENHSFKN